VTDMIFVQPVSQSQQLLLNDRA